MSQPLPPLVPDWAASTPDWPGSPGRRSPSSPYSSPYSASYPSSYPSPTVAAAGAATAVATPRRSKGLLVLGLVAMAGAAGGAVVGALLVAAVFVGSAEAIGEGIGRGMASAEQDFYASMSEEDMDLYLEPLDPADISAPVAPVPGPDPVLDAYAQGCFEGDYQACDDLYFESPPLSDYEEYGGSCGGRVKVYSVMTCTDLD